MQRRCGTSITVMVWKHNDAFLQRKTSPLWCLRLASIYHGLSNLRRKHILPTLSKMSQLAANKHTLNCGMENDVSAFDFSGDNSLLIQYRQCYLKTPSNAILFFFNKVASKPGSRIHNDVQSKLWIITCCHVCDFTSFWSISFMFMWVK